MANTTEAALRERAKHLAEDYMMSLDSFDVFDNMDNQEQAEAAIYFALSQPPASSTAGEDGSLSLGLRQARYALRDYHQKQPDCGFDKLAKICSEAADLLSPSSGEPASVAVEAATFERLKYYPDFIDDPDGLERLRQAVKSNGGHDMAAVNHNTLGRLIDTIERLRHEVALSKPTPVEVGLAKLVREYRPTMDKEVLHSWAQDILAALSETQKEGKP